MSGIMDHGYTFSILIPEHISLPPFFFIEIIFNRTKRKTNKWNIFIYFRKKKKPVQFKEIFFKKKISQNIYIFLRFIINIVTEIISMLYFLLSSLIREWSKWIVLNAQIKWYNERQEKMTSWTDRSDMLEAVSR